MRNLKEVDENKVTSTSVVNVMFPFQVLVMAPANNTINAAASSTIFLGEGTQVKLPYASVYTGPTRAEIKFGTVLLILCRAHRYR